MCSPCRRAMHSGRQKIRIHLSQVRFFSREDHAHYDRTSDYSGRPLNFFWRLPGEFGGNFCLEKITNLFKAPYGGIQGAQTKTHGPSYEQNILTCLASCWLQEVLIKGGGKLTQAKSLRGLLRQIGGFGRFHQAITATAWWLVKIIAANCQSRGRPEALPMGLL